MEEEMRRFHARGEESEFDSRANGGGVCVAVSGAGRLHHDGRPPHPIKRRHRHLSN